MTRVEAEVALQPVETNHPDWDSLSGAARALWLERYTPEFAPLRQIHSGGLGDIYLLDLVALGLIEADLEKTNGRKRAVLEELADFRRGIAAKRERQLRRSGAKKNPSIETIVAEVKGLADRMISVMRA